MIYFEKIVEKIFLNESYTIGFWGDSLTSCEWIHPNYREIIEYVIKSECEKLVLQKMQELGQSDLRSFDGQFLEGEKNETYARRVPSWNIRCINLARDGSTTRDRRNYKEKRIENYAHIDLMLVMGTRNDMCFAIPLEETCENLSSLFAYFREVDRVGQALFVPSPFPCGLSEDLGDKQVYTQQKYGEVVQKAKDILQSNRGFSLWDETQKLSVAEYKSFFGMENTDGSLDQEHPNILGNAYIAQQFLQHIFGITFDYNRYVKEVLDQKQKFPNY